MDSERPVLHVYRLKSFSEEMLTMQERMDLSAASRRGRFTISEMVCTALLNDYFISKTLCLERNISWKNAERSARRGHLVESSATKKPSCI